MTGSSHRPPAVLIAAAAVLAGCGGTSGKAPGPLGAGTTTSGPPPLTHADPVTLLPTSGEVSTLIKPISRPTRHDKRLNPSTVSSAFASRVPSAQRLASGAAELDVAGRKGTFLYAHVFEFKSVASARSLGPTFLSSTRLGTALGRPSGAPGQEGQASSQPYGHHRDVSFRYAFREQNVVAYVELDGPRGRVSLADAIRVAAIVDHHVRARLSSA
jgi:hypothetical protein